MINLYSHEENTKRIQALTKKGYRFEITADGYKVWLGEKFIGGAGVLLPRKKPLHWRHRRANLKDFAEQALLVVDRQPKTKPKRKKLGRYDFDCPKCGTVHTKDVYCIAQQAMHQTINFTCPCGHKFEVPE